MASGRSFSARRMAAGAVLLACLVAVAFLMYGIGKEYEVLIDNKSVSVGGREYGAVPYCSLVIDHDERKAVDMREDDRIIIKMTGKTHTFVVKVLNEDDDSVIKTIERRVELDGYSGALMLSIPAVSGESPEIFVPTPRRPAEGRVPAENDEEPVTDGTDGALQSF
ncbi:hypothetical protein FACS1894216_09070 [Synergistales bacterium]|nr:hypothetical protein FACS1894216_09070 [Synergistales bacterium]